MPPLLPEACRHSPSERSSSDSTPASRARRTAQPATCGGSVMVSWSRRHWTAYCISSLSWAGRSRKSIRALPRSRQCSMNSPGSGERCCRHRVSCALQNWRAVFSVHSAQNGSRHSARRCAAGGSARAAHAAGSGYLSLHHGIQFTSPGSSTSGSPVGIQPMRLPSKRWSRSRSSPSEAQTADTRMPMRTCSLGTSRSAW